MKFKLVFSEVPACSQGHTSNDTLSCLSCGMMHAGSRMKLYVPEDQPVPVSAKADMSVVPLGKEATLTVDFSAAVKKEEVEVQAAAGLEVKSVEVADKTATIKVEAKEPFYGHKAVMVGHKGVKKMFDLVIDKAPVEMTRITLNKTTAEVGEPVKVTVHFSGKVVDGKLPRITLINNTTISKPFKLDEYKTSATCELIAWSTGRKSVNVTYNGKNEHFALTITEATPKEEEVVE